MNKIKNILFPMLLLFSLMATAQNDAQISQQLLSKTNFNPAATGSSVYGNITAIARDQYVGFDGAPYNRHLPQRKDVDAPIS